MQLDGLPDYIHYKFQEFYTQLPELFSVTDCTGGILRLDEKVD